MFWCLSVIEGTDIVVNLIAEDAWYYEDELTGVFSDKVHSWYWLWLYILPMSFPMTNSKTNNIEWYYYEIHNIITKPKFGNIRIINMMMYVTIFQCITPIYLRILF